MEVRVAAASIPLIYSAGNYVVELITNLALVVVGNVQVVVVGNVCIVLQGGCGWGRGRVGVYSEGGLCLLLGLNMLYCQPLELIQV